MTTLKKVNGPKQFLGKPVAATLVINSASTNAIIYFLKDHLSPTINIAISTSIDAHNSAHLYSGSQFLLTDCLYLTLSPSFNVLYDHNAEEFLNRISESLCDHKHIMLVDNSDMTASSKATIDPEPVNGTWDIF